MNYHRKPNSARRFNPTKGKPLEKWEGERPIEDPVNKIWDQPKNGVVNTSRAGPEHQVWREGENKPYPSRFSDMVWKPTATKIDNTYLYSTVIRRMHF
jgi:hypothetical protein